MKRLCGAALMALLAVPACAESPAATGSDLPDRFQIDAGGFRIAADTNLTYNLGGQAGRVDFENELDVPANATTFWLDATWRVGRRHQLKLGFTRSSRQGNGVELQRDITWGGQVFNAGLTATGETKADILAGYYRFALLRRDRFEIGPAVGFGYLWMSASIRATGTVAGAPGAASGTIERSGTTGSVTGDLGAYFNGWLSRRLVARGDLLYVLVKPGNSEASVTDGRLGLYWYPWRNVGFGAQYKYYKYRYDRGIASASLGGSLRFHGAQGYVSFLF